MTLVAVLELRGAGGEPVDLRRTLLSHGVADLPPMDVRADGLAATVTLMAPGGPRTVRIGAAGPDVSRSEPRAGVTGEPEAPGDPPRRALVRLVDDGPAPRDEEAEALVVAVRRMLCLDDDLSRFYAVAARDPALAWATRGAGRLLRSPTVFEDVVKTICTTNCAWSATVRMVGALVGRLGEPAPGAPPGDVAGRAFPAPEAMASAGEEFYRDVVRAGYRGAYLGEIARRVAEGELDLEVLLASTRAELPDEEVERRLLALPGVGPYAAAHVMLLLGRHSRLVFDSWTRPKYARLVGKPAGRLVKDATIERRFRRYREHAGLAFWLVLTRDWVDDGDGKQLPERLSAAEQLPERLGAGEPAREPPDGEPSGSGTR